MFGWFKKRKLKKRVTESIAKQLIRTAVRELTEIENKQLLNEDVNDLIVQRLLFNKCDIAGLTEDRERIIFVDNYKCNVSQTENGEYFKYTITGDLITEDYLRLTTYVWLNLLDNNDTDITNVFAKITSVQFDAVPGESSVLKVKICFMTPCIKTEN